MTEAEATPDRRRRTFGPVVLVGVLAGTAAAMSGTQAWFGGDGSRTTGDGGFESTLSMTVGGADVPALNALALVALACWGVVLVTRGRFRRLVAAVGLVASAGAVAAAANAWLALPDALRDSYAETGITDPDLGSTGWAWIGSVAAVVGVVASLAAVRFVGSWPEMGRRYDAPGAVAAPQSDLDLWKVMDEGRDPTS